MPWSWSNSKSLLPRPLFLPSLSQCLYMPSITGLTVDANWCLTQSRFLAPPFEIHWRLLLFHRKITESEVSSKEYAGSGRYQNIAGFLSLGWCNYLHGRIALPTVLGQILGFLAPKTANHFRLRRRETAPYFIREQMIETRHYESRVFHQNVNRFRGLHIPCVRCHVVPRPLSSEITYGLGQP